MIDYTSAFNRLKDSPLKNWSLSLQAKVKDVLGTNRWGDLPKWSQAVTCLPEVTPSVIGLTESCITIGRKSDCDEKTRAAIEKNLRALHPWRKGPFNVFGIHVDTEWRSDMKWERLEGYLSSLEGRLVLDVGCGSGYHCLRMCGAGAELVIGIDPTLLYCAQFQALQKYIRNDNGHVLPIGIDDMPDDMNIFDTVFSMGLLYHRRSPLDHLLKLKSLLRSGGELVLETLVIEGDENAVLTPEGRYAKMPNVWFIPSVSVLQTWLKRTGFTNACVIDVNRTSSKEQRATDWMGFESLSDFLDPADITRTVEGYPAPRRAIVLASAYTDS